MAHAYTSVPDGAILNIPPAIPQGMLYRVKSIQGVSKQLLKLVPNSGQTSVSAGQKIIVSLPANSLVDLSTFDLTFTGKTQHGGNGATWATTAGTSGNVSNYVNKRYFPRNTASLIENLEIKINGQSRQNIPMYNFLYNILYDYTCGDDANRKTRIGCNGDPSNKTITVSGGQYRVAGYPVGLYTIDGSNDWSCRDAETYTIRQWLGMLGNSSTNIIDTSIYGQIDIEITLAQSGILNLSTPLGALPTLGALSAAVTEVGVASTAGATPGAVAAEGTGYTLSNISFSIVRYDMPSTYYDAVRSVLQSGAVYKLFYPNYLAYQGNVTANKSGTTRFTLSTGSLDMVIGTFFVQNRDVQCQALLGTKYAKSGDVTGMAGGEYGLYAGTFNNAVNKGLSMTLNNSKYFLRNGSGVQSATWIVGNVRLAPENIQEQYNGVLKAFNTQGDTLGGMYPGIQSISHYESQFYAHILSLNVTGEKDLYTVSGLNSSEIPVSIAWEVSGGGSISNIDTNANGNIFVDTTTNTQCTPVLFACMSSHLEVSAGRNVVTFV